MLESLPSYKQWQGFLSHGNLTKDSNKNISSIAYNVLNLPSTVTFSDGSTITYSYAADGTKLRTVHTISGTTTQKDYCANVVYENGVQKMLLTEEGYVDLSASTPTYYYYLKDHQGNNRVVLSSGGTAVETNHYYPFGGLFDSDYEQPYKYNGKELDTKKGLNWYDYGARHYDAMLGRWLVVDPLAEKYYAWSSYAYCNNNPIGAIDSEGKLVIFINGFHHGFEGASFKYWNTIYGQFDDAVMTHFGDNKSLYYDGSMGGLLNLLASGNLNGSNYINTYPHNRYNWGYSLGKIQAGRIISQLTRDAKGNISEAVRVVSHSMGSVFAKGFVQALINYVKMHPEECQGFMISEYDFAPFQPTSYPAVDGVSTYQYSHKYDLIAKNARVLGAEIMKTSENVEDGHSIEDYYKYIISLPEGNYKFINGEFVKQ